MVKNVISVVIILIFFSCSSEVPEIINSKQGSLKASMTLKAIDIKKFPLDSNTAPKPQYIQIFVDSTNHRKFTFINTYNNSIYFYDYNNTKFEKKITFDKQGPNAFPYPTGYYIKSIDSIYICDYQSMELILTNSSSEILKKLPLLGYKDFRKNPEVLVRNCQYFPETSTPFFKVEDKLMLPGYYMGVIPDSLINKIKFVAKVDMKNGNLDHIGVYPKELYGSKFTWGDPIFTKVYPQYVSNKKQIIFSFPVSHNLYIKNLNSSNYQVTFGGSNYAGTIKPLEKMPEKITREEGIQHVIEQDLYSAILYDKYRKVYYRFLRRAVINSTIDTKIKEKPIAVIILDDNFNYLGETVIGNSYEWNWDNSFVTEEGLNIEYLDEGDIDEVYMTFKTFLPYDI